jgi:hypothetical protein
MAVILKFPSHDERKYRALTAAERAFAEHLLKLAPDYRYDRSGLPTLQPPPAPGAASAIAAAKMMSACCKFGTAG